jgi:hypothetical protein
MCLRCCSRTLQSLTFISWPLFFTHTSFSLPFSCDALQNAAQYRTELPGATITPFAAWGPQWGSTVVIATPCGPKGWQHEAGFRMQITWTETMTSFCSSLFDIYEFLSTSLCKHNDENDIGNMPPVHRSMPPPAVAA